MITMDQERLRKRRERNIAIQAAETTEEREERLN